MSQDEIIQAIHSLGRYHEVESFKIMEEYAKLHVCENVGSMRGSFSKSLRGLVAKGVLRRGIKIMDRPCGAVVTQGQKRKIFVYSLV